MVVPLWASVSETRRTGSTGTALDVFLQVDAAVLADFDAHPLAEGVDDACADAVQTRGDFVAAAAELAAGVQHGHDDLERGLLHLWLQVDGDTPTVVRDGDRAVSVDGHLDTVVVAGERLVDGVVDELVDHVVQAVDIGVADVHARSAPNSLEAFEHLNIRAGVIPGRHEVLEVRVLIVVVRFLERFVVA